jgi:hypothetical protein
VRNLALNELDHVGGTERGHFQSAFAKRLPQEAAREVQIVDQRSGRKRTFFAKIAGVFVQ